MAIEFFSEDISFQLDNEKLIQDWISFVLHKHDAVMGDLNYIFTSNREILKINKQFLGHDYFTDIITFNYCDADVVSGDIYISIETVEENAKDFDVVFQQELNRVMIHGVLHLLGFDDATDEERALMRRKEDECLADLEKLS
ncbi:MAG: rRNA maturation RNase YbeY [Bacteroidota bacterium]|jgi:rRNA maturation RNase YbeY